MMNLSKKRIVVTGGAGFLGRWVVEGLKKRQVREVFIPRSKDYDLREKANIERLFKEAKPDVIIHLAAVVGGIGANRKHPGKFFYDNAIMGIQLMEACRIHGIEKLVNIGTICMYPKYAQTPFKESEIWNGYPEETNAPYGIAKKMLLVQAQSYREEYGLNAITLLPTNLYGPGDSFDLENSHVIPALIKKCVDAKEAKAPEIILWGDGSPSREFLYVEDAAEGILLATEQYDGREPINLGVNQEIQIKDLAQLIAQLVEYPGKIVWDTSQPNGQPRRKVDATLAKKYFNFNPQTPLKIGLKKAIEWYLDHKIPSLDSLQLTSQLNAA